MATALSGRRIRFANASGGRNAEAGTGGAVAVACGCRRWGGRTYATDGSRYSTVARGSLRDRVRPCTLESSRQRVTGYAAAADPGAIPMIGLPAGTRIW